MRGPNLLVVGAGPTGLTLALQAHDHGAQVRIVDRRAFPSRHSHALLVHPRTLEVLHPLGITKQLLSTAAHSPRFDFHLGHRRFPIDLTNYPQSDTPYPHLVLIRQSDVEAALTAALTARGIEIEWNTTLHDLVVDDEGATAVLERRARRMKVSCRYLVGCDGRESTVRRATGIGWDTRPYRHTAVLMDLELDRPHGPAIARVAVARGGLMFLFPLGESAPWRLVVVRVDGPEPSPRQLQRYVDETGLDVRIARVAWQDQIPLRRGVAAQYRDRSAFLAGDAAHTSSPAGGQGMNAGIQDAVNIGWKLAFAARQPTAAVEALLGSYETERRAIAHRIVDLTHLLFTAESTIGAGVDLTGRAIGLFAAPLMPILLRNRRIPSRALRMVSGLDWDYRDSPLSIDAKPRPSIAVAAGARLPDEEVIVGGRGETLHNLMAAPGVHILLGCDAPIGRLTHGHAMIHVHRIESWPGAAIVVVRPDGHVGYRDVSPTGARSWLKMGGAIG